MHVVIRYEIEKKLFSGEITAKDLPEIWNRLYKEYLGVDVPNDTQGVLQDSHWSGGGFGYFPSYALGSAYAAQLFETMKKDFDVEKEIENGNLEKINAWLREKIWKFGCMKEPGDLMKDAFGEFDPKYYTEYLKNKYMEIYK
ncbi:MAG: carboxypeptidase M32 [Clostridiales bacterium]|nr:carboxypeptidase M32 [Clostridiales bacterium]